jgi:hypothetical protein
MPTRKTIRTLKLIDSIYAYNHPPPEHHEWCFSYATQSVTTMQTFTRLMEERGWCSVPNHDELKMAKASYTPLAHRVQELDEMDEQQAIEELATGVVLIDVDDVQWRMFEGTYWCKAAHMGLAEFKPFGRKPLSDDAPFRVLVDCQG